MQGTLKQQRETKNRYAKQLSQAGRDVGAINSVFNKRRRNSCEFDLTKFCLTYNPEAFTLKFSSIHNQMIARMEEAILEGALYAFACPRGTGKTTLARMAALWAISYGHRRYVFLIGANAGKAQDSLAAVKVWMRFLENYAVDFPEVSQAVRHLNGIANRASGQLCQGNPTMIEWSKECVTLPTVPAPPNVAKKKGEIAKTSGSVIGVSGLTGDGIRGSLKTLLDGSQLRPDFVLLDDPQTDESSTSPSQNTTREKLISGAVLGMAGPGKKISAVMPCTVINQDDMADRLLDREKHPLWRGTRTQMLSSMPTNMEEWDKYFEVYQACALLEPPNFKEANKLYRRKRKVLDAGAEATWPERKNDDEVSAIQHAMHLYCRDQLAFASEYQNDPINEEFTETYLSKPEILAKQHAQKRGLVPQEAATIKGYVDVQMDVMFYEIWAYSDRFDGFKILEGTWPDQKRPYFTKSNLRHTLKKKYKRITSLEGRIRQGVLDLWDYLLGMEFKRDGDSNIMQISKLGTDTGYHGNDLRAAWRDTPHKSRIQLTRGQGYTASKKPQALKTLKKGEQSGFGWYLPLARNRIRTLEIDTNKMKSFFHRRLQTSLGDPGSFSLYKAPEKQHQLAADHYKAERPLTLEGPYGKVEQWEELPGQDNDFFDCAVGCAAIASFDGVAMIGTQETQGRARRNKRKKTKVTF